MLRVAALLLGLLAASGALAASTGLSAEFRPVPRPLLMPDGSPVILPTPRPPRVAARTTPAANPLERFRPTPRPARAPVAPVETQPEGPPETQPETQPDTPPEAPPDDSAEDRTERRLANLTQGSRPPARPDALVPPGLIRTATAPPETDPPVTPPVETPSATAAEPETETGPETGSGPVRLAMLPVPRPPVPPGFKPRPAAATPRIPAPAKPPRVVPEPATATPRVPRPAPPRPSAPVDVVMVGDSITAGGRWSRRFPNVHIVNRGVSGDTALKILNRMDGILDTRAKRALLMFGINDIYNGVPVDRIVQRYDTIIRQLKTRKFDVVIQSTLACTGQVCGEKLMRVYELNQKLRKLARSHRVPFVDINRELSDRAGLKGAYSRDGVHLNGDGYARWYAMLTPYISS